MTVHRATDYLNDFGDVLVEEFNGWIDRRFASQRVIRLEVCPDGRWCAILHTGETSQLLFPPCPDLGVVYRFVRAFARKEGVTADVSLVDDREHSVRVEPSSNVVSLLERIEA